MTFVVRVVAPTFVAGVVVDARAQVVRSAPILRRVARAGVVALVDWARARGFEVTAIK